MKVTFEAERLKVFLVEKGATFRPGSKDEVALVEKGLGFSLSEEYRQFLLQFGFIVCESCEVYGVGVPSGYYLYVLNAFADLSQDSSFPASSVPLVDAGDGHYYLYSNEDKSVLLWATPNGGVIGREKMSLNAFLLHYLSS